MSLNLVLSFFDQSLLAVVLFLTLLLLIFKRTTSQKIRLPPSPPKLPIIGNLHQLSSLLHRSLHSLSKNHGPLILLQLGQVPTLVVSSADFAGEIMKTHDAIFASRPALKAARILLFGCRDLIFAPYGEYWRQVRELCVTHLLGAKMVPSFRRLREEEVASMITEIWAICSSTTGSVDMSKILNLFTNNIVCRAVLGKSFRGEDKSKIFCELTEENVILLVKFWFGDCFPVLGWLDVVSGLERRARKSMKRWDVVLDEVIEDHVRKLEDKDYKPETKDFVDVLLTLQNDPSADFAVNRELIKALVLDMIGAGTDRSFITLEWAMTELVRNPRVMKKLQEEVRGNSANRDLMIREENLSGMNYLKAVIKESSACIPLLLCCFLTNHWKLARYKAMKFLRARESSSMLGLLGGIQNSGKRQMSSGRRDSWRAMSISEGMISISFHLARVAEFVQDCTLQSQLWSLQSLISCIGSTGNCLKGWRWRI